MVIETRVKPTVLVDCDDVLLECSQKAIREYNMAHTADTPITQREITKWGQTGKITDNLLPFYEKQEFYQTQNAEEGAEEFLKNLTQKANVYLLTAVPVSCAAQRAQRLLELFPWFPQKNIIISAKKEFIKADYLLDDGLHNIEAAAKKDIITHPVLFRKPWNSNASGILAVNTYNDFLTLIDLNETDNHVKTRPVIVAVIAPTGSEKTEVVKCLRNKGMRILKSYTTAKTTDSQSYVQLTPEDFAELEDCHMLFESTVYGGNKYGMSIHETEKALSNNTETVTALDISGLIQLKTRYRNRVLGVYIDKPKEQIIRNIIEKKELDTEEKVSRIMYLEDEIKNKNICDICVSATTPEEASEEILNYVNSL